MNNKLTKQYNNYLILLILVLTITFFSGLNAFANIVPVTGAVRDFIRIDGNTTGLNGLIDSGDFMTVISTPGDIDGDGVNDLAVGAPRDGDYASGAGAVYTILLNSDNTIKSTQKISAITAPDLITDIIYDQPSCPGCANNTFFGSSLSSLGDWDGDGVVDLLVGASNSDAGSTTNNRFFGSAAILLLNNDGSYKDHHAINHLNYTTSFVQQNSQTLGSDNISVGDIDNDGVVDILSSMSLRDDINNDEGALVLFLMNNDGTVKSDVLIPASSIVGDNSGIRVGSTIVNMGDINGGGSDDILVTSTSDRAFIINLDSTGNVTYQKELNNTDPNFPAILNSISSAGIGADYDQNGFPDILLSGLESLTPVGLNRGVIFSVSITSDFNIVSSSELTSTNFNNEELSDDDRIGNAGIEVLSYNGNGLSTIVTTARKDIVGTNDGAIYILRLDRDLDMDGHPDSVETASGSDINSSISIPLDTDGDGVPDIVEIEEGSDPLDNTSVPSDSDGDGHPDYVENGSGSDSNDIASVPLDTDGDMVPDFVEIMQNTNPNNATDYFDADGDMVPSYVESINGTDSNNSSSFIDTDNGGVSDYVETTLIVNVGLVAGDISDSENDSDLDGDGILNSEELTAPNSGDGNGDGVKDFIQSNVSSVLNSITLDYNTLESTGDCKVITGYSIIDELINSSQDDGYVYPLGMHNFILNCPTPGQSGNVTIFWGDNHNTSNWSYRKFINSSYLDITSNVTLGTQTVGDVIVTTSSFSLTDGGEYDIDGEVNGIIVDPSGPAILEEARTLIRTGGL